MGMERGTFENKANSAKDMWELNAHNTHFFEWKLSDSIGSFLPDSFEAIGARDSGYSHHLNVIPLLHNQQECIGRDEDLAYLHLLLQKPDMMVAVEGEAGIGKTTLVKAYLTKNQHLYQHLVWIDYQKDLEQSFVDDPHLLGLIDPSERDDRYKAVGFFEIIKVLNTLSGPNLLVIDNNDTYFFEEYKQNLLPTKNGWKTIIISRETAHLNTLKIEELESVPAYDLFHRHYQNKEETKTYELLALAKFNPLKIKLFAQLLTRFQGWLSVQSLLKNKEINFDFLAQYLQHSQDNEAISSQLSTWLSLSGESELIKDVVVDYLDKHAKDKEAGQVMSAWLDKVGDSEIIRLPIIIYLDEHVTDAESYYLIISWLDATNDGLWIDEQINTYLNLYSKTKKGSLLKLRWNNQKFKNITRLKDLVANGKPREALDILVTWAPNHFRDEIIMQRAKLVNLEHLVTRELIDYSTLNIERARATKSLLNLIQRLEEEAFEPNADQNIQKTEVKEPSIHFYLLTKVIFLFIHAFNELLETSRNEKDLFWSDLNRYADIKPVLLENFSINDLVQSFTDHNQNLYFAHISNHFTEWLNTNHLGKTFFSTLLADHSKHSLQWVMLNGFESYTYVDSLLANNVSAVITTTSKIDQKGATQLIRSFYKGFFEKNYTLKDAFEYGASTIPRLYPQVIVTHPGERSYEDDSIASVWTLFVNSKDQEILNWTLGDFLPKKSISLEQIISLIDSDMFAAFELLEQLDWGNRRGTYTDFKIEWVNSPQGFSKSNFRKRLKSFVTTFAQSKSLSSQQNLSAIQKEAKEKIIKGTNLAINFLEEELRSGNAKDFLALIKAEWQKYREEEMLGSMDFNQKQQRGNTLRNKLMTFINDLKEDDLG